MCFCTHKHTHRGKEGEEREMGRGRERAKEKKRRICTHSPYNVNLYSYESLLVHTIYYFCHFFSKRILTCMIIN
jgi:endonuclease IV